MRTLTRVGVFVAASSAALLLSPVAHATGGDTSTVQLRQELPRTATTDGAPQQSHEQCPGIAEDMDGWHFVLPGNKADFVKLTVTFSPGGEQVVTDFSGFPGADGKHVYVASEPGAELTSAVAEITGSVPQDLFNLSHTCPADGGTTPGGSDDDTDGDTGEGGSGEEAGGTTPSTAPSESVEATEAPAASPSASEEAAAPAASSSPSAQGGSAEGDLAETGNGAPVGLLAGAAAALLAAGGYLVFRRRKTSQG